MFGTEIRMLSESCPTQNYTNQKGSVRLFHSICFVRIVASTSPRILSRGAEQGQAACSLRSGRPRISCFCSYCGRAVPARSDVPDREDTGSFEIIVESWICAACSRLGL